VVVVVEGMAIQDPVEPVALVAVAMVVVMEIRQQPGLHLQDREVEGVRMQRCPSQRVHLVVLVL
jgi:hypothetical protein